MNDNSLVTVEDRSYVDPNVSLGETNTFIDNLRQIQSQNNQQISEQTRNLGSDLPLSMGGLDSGSGIWQSRYQTPQVDSAVASLRATTQAQALSQLLSNELAKKQQQYKRAYRAAYKKKEAEEKAKEKAKESTPAGKVKDVSATPDKTGTGSTRGLQGYTVIGDPVGNTYVSNGQNQGWVSSGQTYDYTTDDNNNYQWWNPFTWF